MLSFNFEGTLLIYGCCCLWDKIQSVSVPKLIIAFEIKDVEILETWKQVSEWEL